MSHAKRDSACYRPYDAEWEAKEELQLRELEEARARAAQMEKTMRWWSDCTANWREKWSKVRIERNKAREEARLLRGKVESCSKEAANLRRDKQEMESEMDKLRREIDYLRITEEHRLPQQDVPPLSAPSSTPVAPSNASTCDLEYFERLLDQEASNGQKGSDVTDQKASLLQLRLEEAVKMLHSERLERSQLQKNLEKQAAELAQLKAKHDELHQSRQNTLKELNQVRAEHQDELDCIRMDLEDEASGRTCLDQRLTELRSQGENAAEWGRRERLETEKLALERDNKSLKASLRELEEQLQHCSEQSLNDVDHTALQVELQQKNKELCDLKHAHCKLKKVLQEKSTELLHELRRSEQYEVEVKKLRGRIEELKRELAAAEDEVDSSTNNIRKLQRSNDELQEQVETLQVQIEHLQTSSREGHLPSDNLGTIQAEEQHVAEATQLAPPQQPRSAGC
ncbi:coiled-coil domain-containing protein 102A-like isoform X2 [Ornithodoros turicata]|uniref:coiled-coil domain-containing protein 102A-like isoform X2 n=1 Tax=Ornithodoros turicata TaxID=34597 RepID=UPI0031389B5D